MNEIIISNTNGLLTVSSLQVAKDFGKEHKNVIQSIENLVKQTSAEISADVKTENFTLKNMFIESTYMDKYSRLQKYYEITRDGFSLLVMGFTGKKALNWKLRYIEAFNSMERQLTNINASIEEIVRKVLDENIADVISTAINSALDEKSGEVIAKAVQDTVDTLAPCSYLLDTKIDILDEKINKLEKYTSNIEKIVKDSEKPANSVFCQKTENKIRFQPLENPSLVFEFINECCECRCGSYNNVSTSDLYRAFEKWCLQKNVNTVRKSVFINQICAYFHTNDKKDIRKYISGKWYYLITLTTSAIKNLKPKTPLFEYHM